MAFNTTRSLDFDVRASTSRSGLAWRVSAASSDILTPSGGGVASSGTTTVNASDIVLDSLVTIEVYDDSGDVLLAFTLKHY